MMRWLIGIAAFVLFAVTSLTRSSEATQAIPEDFVITLERTACFGACPVYSVSIDAKGNVIYDGMKFVRIIGRQTDRIAVPRVAALVETVDRIRFFELEDKYQQMITDLPTTFVTVTRDGRSKRVEDYFGAPQSLKELEGEIDQTARTARWIDVNRASAAALVVHMLSDSHVQYYRLDSFAGNPSSSRGCLMRRTTTCGQNDQQCSYISRFC